MCPARTARSSQTRSGRSAQHESLDATWGDSLPETKNQQHYRVFGLNIDGFSNHNPDKFNYLQYFINTHDPDAVCLSETSLLWHKIPEEKRLSQRVRDWWKGGKTYCAYNIHDKTDTDNLAGGVAIILRGHRASSVIEDGRDPSGLGRWVWVRIRGFGGRTLLLVSAYRPVKNDGDTTAYVQHDVFFKEQDPPRDQCPRDAFLQDLVEDLTRFHEKGDHIMVSMDANEPQLFKVDNPVEKRFAPLSIKDMILQRHDRTKAPRTYERGSKPIDGIFTTPALASYPCGYFSFNDSPGDHRALWCEIPLFDIFGESANQPSAPSRAKRLKCKDPRSVKKFHKHAKPRVTHHNLVHRAVALESSVTPNEPLTDIQQQEWEAIDTLRVAIYISSEKKCRRLYTGAISWTPAYQKAVAIHRFWNLMVKKLSGKKVSFKYLKRWAKRAGVLTELHAASLEYAQERKKSSWADLKQIRKRSHSARMGWLASLAAARADAGLETAKKALEVMRSRERQRRNARLIKFALSDTARQSLREVKAPHLGEWINGEWHGSWKTIKEKEEMERECLNETNRRFRQANDTPLFIRPVMDLTGPVGCSEACKNILYDGDVSAFEPYLDTPTLDYLKQHHTPSLRASRGVFSMHITTAQHVASWLHADEDTTCGPSGLLFSHFIANAHDPFLATLDATMTSIPAITGFSPSRWRGVLDVMIPKKADDPRVTKLRTILLYEPDFNMMNKLMGRRMMLCAEYNDRVALEQYGSRKGHSSVDQSLNKRLTFDFIRQTLLRCGLISNDAKSCYDRIIHAAAGLAMQRGGAPPSAITCMFDTIQHLRHYIRTAHGDSTYFIDADADVIPIQGVGQGNGAGPAIWAVVSSPIFDSMRRRGYGVYIRSPVSDESFLFVGYAFVDDTDLVISDDPNAPLPASLFEQIQAGVTFWEQSIRASGGAIAPEKCFWYNLDFTWTNGDWQFVKPKQSDPILQVRDPYGNMKAITQLDPTKGDLTLGIKVAPDGNNNDEFEYLLEKVKTWAEKVCTKRLPRHLVWQSLTTGIYRSLIYPLAATTFSQTECNRLRSALLQTALPYSGIDRSMPYDIVHAPLSRGGLALPDLHVEQGIAHLGRLIRFGNSYRYITGYLIRADLENLTMELGLPGSPFEHNYNEWKDCITKCWVTCAWKFQSLHNIQVQTSLPKIPLRRTGDLFLMQLFHQAGFSGQQRRLLNKCRNFLQVFTVSDITDVHGTRILPFAWRGTHPSTSRDHYHWTRSPPSEKLAWDLWRTAITKVLGVTGRFNYLHVPLGPWTTTFTGPSWYLSLESGRLLRQVTTMDWEVFSAAPSRTSRARFHLKHSQEGSTAVRKAYKPLIRVDVEQSGNFWTTVQQDLAVQPFDDSHLLQTQDEIFNELGWCAGTWFIPPTPATLLKLRQAIQSGNFEAVSDGSFINNEGSASWCAASSSEEVELISAGLRVPGDIRTQSPYRSEMAGIFSMLYFVRFLVKEMHIPTGKVTLGCDGLSVLKRTSHDTKEATTTDSNWDLLSGIQQMMREMPQIEVNWKHVYGHQDDKMFGPFDIWTTRNINMDIRADFVWDAVSPLPADTAIPHSYWPVLVNGVPLASDLAETIREQCRAPPAEQYWVNKGKLDVTPASHVAWPELGTAMQESKLTRRHWVTKHCTQRCAVGRVMLRRKEWTHSRCPRCNMDNETTTHVLQCPFPDAKQVWADSISNLETWLKSIGTHPHLTQIICTRLMEWHDSSPLSSFSSSVPELMDTVARQDAIGWESAIEGRWDNSWKEIQDSYYKWKGRRNTGRRWLTAIIKRMWDIAWDLWNHRNTVRLEEEAAAAKRKVHKAITAQFLAGFRDLLTSEHKLLTSRSLQTRLSDPLFRQQAWLRRIRACRKRGEALRFQRERNRSRLLLRDWLSQANAPS